MIINLELYRTFITVAEEGSFTGAARELGLTQSAVSQSIRQLEDLLGAQLFVRTGRGAVLTDAGSILMGHVGGLLDGVESAQHYFAQLRDLTAGSLKIGASDTLSRHVLLPHLRTFHERYPHIAIQVTNRTSDETIGLLRQGRVDVGFVNLPVESQQDFIVQPLQEVRDCFICGMRYFADFSRPVPFEALADFPLLMLERLSASRRYLDNFLSGEGVHLRPQIELGSLDLLVEFARAGLGIAAVTREFIYIPDPWLHIIETQKPIPPRSVAMILRKNSPPTFALKVFTALFEA